jgi:hypothetical protein
MASDVIRNHNMISPFLAELKPRFGFRKIQSELLASASELGCSDRVFFVLQKNRFSVTPIFTKTPIHLKVDTPGSSVSP